MKIERLYGEPYNVPEWYYWLYLVFLAWVYNNTSLT